jgi:hypothetical protein
LGSSLPPTELARRDLALFGEVKRLSFIAPEAIKGGESPERFSLKKVT